MTGTAYPGDAVTGVPSYTATQGRTALAAMVGGVTTGRPLGGFSGVRPGTPSNIATATSTTWTVTPFGGYIDLEALATNGGYFFSFQANETGSVTAAAVSARVDLLYVQVNDSNTGDGSGLSPRATLGYQAGVAGAGVPTLSAARAFVIAQINVPASGGGSPTVSWVAPYTAAAGGILPASSSATYPAAATYPGQYVDDLALGGLLRSNGTAFIPVSGGLVPIVPTSVVGGTVSGFGAVTFTAAAAVSLNGVFTSAYDNYLLVYDIPTKSAGAAVQFRVRLAGTDASGTSDYIYQLMAAASTSAIGATGATSAGYLQTTSTTQNSGKIELNGIAIARATRWTNQDIGYTGSGNSFQFVSGGGQHAQAVAYDGLSILPGTGTITGTVHVYGYVK